ncbi:MAG: HAD-IA family hydrolase [Verrucomicrobia bacterium]|nr:HAD-IA family hydrolase [Verrucomicrobiota bacterium]
MFTPKAVIFDFFGTLVPNFSLTEHKAVLREMAGLVGAPPEAFVKEWLATFTPRVTGQYPTVAANIEAICAVLGVPAEASACARAVALRLDYSRQHLTPRTTAISTLRAIRGRGFKLGLISDCSYELPTLWAETVFAERFEVAVFSCVAKVKKPHAAIYRQAAEQLGVACTECWFVGDGGSNELAGAQAVGMYPVQFYDEAEQGQDTHRVDGQGWTGRRILDLAEVLPLLAAAPQPIVR